ncbi:hypothetical protein V1512DRAFT_242167 [Lipomyces arxii]|uniref:uncharacterized protein n=1 Tax=Lipomyces arxii TaxID=56418 RepID=UPI0034CE226F
MFRLYTAKTRNSSYIQTSVSCPKSWTRSLKNSQVTPSKLSKLFLPSGNKAAASGERESTTDLLARAGFIRKSSAGVFSLLPLGALVQRKLAAIIHRNMYYAGASEVSLPSLLTPTAWKATGRYENSELYKLKDSSESEFLLAPTHEEEITSLVAKDVSSFKQLPLRLYQIGRKYRDERRPRGGMLRGREFLMLDLYSFDSTTESALETYKDIRAAYKSIFDSIGVKYVISEADSGSIGGDLSHEYHYVSSAGEDTLVVCGSCGYTANNEVAVSYPSHDHAPDADSVAVTYGLTKDGILLVMYHPPDRVVNYNIIKKEIPTYDSSIKDPVTAFTKDVDPMLQRIIRVYDERVPEQASLPDLPVTVNIGNITTVRFPCVEVALKSHPRELCPVCEDVLDEERAIEVGHTFYLGKKYSEPLKATFTDKDGSRKFMEMGCFGIGMSRIISAITEVTRDQKGLVWPVSVCPYEVVIVPKPNSDKIDNLAVKIFTSLREIGCEVVVDDRDKSFAWKLGDAKFLGFPVSVVIGNQFLQSGEVHVESRRTGKVETCTPEEVAARVAYLLKSERTKLI